MEICIEVTSHVTRTVSLPESGDLAQKLLAFSLRRDLVRTSPDRLHIRNLFGRHNIVQDVDRYAIVDCGTGVAVNDHDLLPGAECVSEYPYVDRPAEHHFEGATLVLLLESPHRDEYGGSIRNPVAPARGRTGAGIHKHLSSVLRSCDRLLDLVRPQTPMRVVIANPIPYQTSAYAIHGGRLSAGDSASLRDKIWRALWTIESPNGTRVFQHDFLRRLGLYAPEVIVNACTGGKAKGGLRRLVTNALPSEYRDRLFVAHHPAAWKSETVCSEPP